MNRYRLYPVPHSLEYRDVIFGIPKEVRLESNVSLSEAVMARLEEALALKSISRNDEATYTLSVKVDPALESENYDYNELEITAEEIRILAADQAAVFYALTSLYHILRQSDEKLEELLLKDYADTKLRGLIEGYYGIPWSDESRKSIMAFGSYFKMNIYAFAPKDDPYHRDLWWELYPEEQLAVISSLAKFGESCYNHYTWTIAPFKADAKPIREENKEEGLAKLIAKFEQLYAAGVRQFGILGDDVGNLPYETVVYVMNEMNAWRKKKGDVRDLVFCPEGYNMADWAFKDGSELNMYDRAFDPDIHIFFTGMSTCSPASAEAVQNFKTRATTGKERRDPLFWMNWPVNDIDRDDYRRLFMGKGEVYEPGVEGMIGVLTNPMEEAEASKVALFATLDYAWNVFDFDCDKSWEDSFSYIDLDAAEELRELSRHMSEITNGAKADAAESEELALVVEAFDRAYAAGSFVSEAKALSDAYERIVTAASNFALKTKNKQLLKEMTPYINNLSEKSRAAILYIKALADQDQAAFEEAERLIEASRKHFIATRTAEFPNTELRAQTGALVIDKNIEALRLAYKN